MVSGFSLSSGSGSITMIGIRVSSSASSSPAAPSDEYKDEAIGSSFSRASVLLFVDEASKRADDNSEVGVTPDELVEIAVVAFEVVYPKERT